ARPRAGMQRIGTHRPEDGPALLPKRRSEHLHLLALEAEFALGLVDGDFVLAAPAGGAVGAGLLLQAGEHAVEAEVGESVYLEEIADLLDGSFVRDQLCCGGEIDAVEARVADRGTGNSEMNLLGTGVAEGAHLASRCGAADDGVFDQDDALARDDVGDDVEL